jgi:hypothetical protein
MALHPVPRPIPAVTMVLVLAIAFALQPVSALTVEGAKIMEDVMPGTTYQFPMAVSIRPDEPAADYAVEVVGFGQSAAGAYTLLSAPEDTGPFSARPLVTVGFPLVHLAPGQRKAFNATIRVPRNAGAGGRYAIIHVHPSGGAGGQASFAAAVMVPVMLTVKGTTLTHTGSITNLVVGEVVPGKPIEIDTTLKNTGNHHYYGARVNVTVTDSSGKAIASGSTPTVFALIPGNEITFKTPIAAAITHGTYTVKAEARRAEGGFLLDSKTTPLTIRAGYVPPFQETSITLAPGGPATLATPGGEVTILFPQGSVISVAQMTVKPPPGALPPPPAGATPGSTSLSIEGITGLLSKDATVTVRYIDDDLKAAGGTPSRLAIARWDADRGQWTLLPTAVDTGQRTLTATTNRLGTFQVMGSEQPPAPPQGRIPWPDALVTIAMVSAAILLRSARSRR